MKVLKDKIGLLENITMNNYILDENNNVIPGTFQEWRKLFCTNNKKRFVKQEEIGVLFISTVFLGMDHGRIADNEPGTDYRPVIFETMIFNNLGHEIYCTQCSTWQEAEDAHKKAIEWANSGYKFDE